MSEERKILGLWTDISEKTGKYEVLEGERPRFMTEDQITNDPKFGTTATLLEFSEDFKSVSMGYYEGQVKITAENIGATGFYALPWEVLVAAVLAACDKLQDLEEQELEEKRRQ